MALKKWRFGTRLSQQITEQNANIDRIDKFITGSGWKPITLSTGWEEFSAADKPMYFDYGLFYIIKGRIKPVEAGVINSDIGNLGITIPKAFDYAVATTNPSMPTGSIYILNSGVIRVRNISSTSSFVSLDGIIIPK